jgi:hypothetical protein
MTLMRAALLSLFMFAAIAMGAIGIYSADAGAGMWAVDGYGVSAQGRQTAGR